jgi:hypothetical protein
MKLCFFLSVDLYAGESTSFNNLCVIHSFRALYCLTASGEQINVTSSRLPPDMVWAMLSGIAGGKRIHQITKDQRKWCAC